MNKSRYLNFIYAALGIISAVLAFANSFPALGIPVDPTLASYWHQFLVSIPAIRYTLLFVGDFLDDGVINNSFQDPSAGGKSAPKTHLLATALLIPAMFLSGCAGNRQATVDPTVIPVAKPVTPTAQKWKATGSIAAKTLGKFALNFAQQWFISQADNDKKANWMDAAAFGLRTVDPQVVDLEQPVREIFNTWLPEKSHWNKLQDITVELVKHGVDLEEISAELNKQAAKLRE